MIATRTLQLVCLLSLPALASLASISRAGDTGPIKSVPEARQAAARSKKAGAVKKAAAAHHVVPFIADDLARALADAKKTNRPIFVESWAPW